MRWRVGYIGPVANGAVSCYCQFVFRKSVAPNRSLHAVRWIVTDSVVGQTYRTRYMAQGSTGQYRAVQVVRGSRSGRMGGRMGWRIDGSGSSG